MQRALIATAAAVALAAPATARADTPSLALRRLTGAVSGSLGVPQPGVRVTVALERNHRTADGHLLEHAPVASATTSTDADGAWSVQLARPWGADPRDEVTVHYDTPPAGVADVDVAALAPDGTRVLALLPSTVTWSPDGHSLTVDCGDSGAGAAGSCAGVRAAVAGRAGAADGVLAPGSTRLWGLDLGAAVGPDDHVLLSETRPITDVAGHAVALVLTRDAGMPRGADRTVTRVAGLPPRCAYTFATAVLRCFDLEQNGTYVAEGSWGSASLAYNGVATTFGAVLRSVSPGTTVAVRRAAGGPALTVLHVAPRASGGCAPGDWLGRAFSAADLARTPICPATGRMAGVDSDAVEMDELSGGWTVGEPPVSGSSGSGSTVQGSTPVQGNLGASQVGVSPSSSVATKAGLRISSAKLRFVKGGHGRRVLRVRVHGKARTARLKIRILDHRGKVVRTLTRTVRTNRTVSVAIGRLTKAQRVNVRLA